MKEESEVKTEETLRLRYPSTLYNHYIYLIVNTLNMFLKYYFHSYVKSTNIL